MTDIFLDFRPTMSWTEKKKIEKALTDVGTNDQLVIMIDPRDAHQADGLFEILEEYGFDYQPKTGGGNPETYNIIARRKY